VTVPKIAEESSYDTLLDEMQKEEGTLLVDDRIHHFDFFWCMLRYVSALRSTECPNVLSRVIGNQPYYFVKRMLLKGKGSAAPPPAEAAAAAAPVLRHSQIASHSYFYNRMRGVNKVQFVNSELDINYSTLIGGLLLCAFAGPLWGMVSLLYICKYKLDKVCHHLDGCISGDVNSTQKVYTICCGAWNAQRIGVHLLRSRFTEVEHSRQNVNPNQQFRDSALRWMWWMAYCSTTMFTFIVILFICNTFHETFYTFVHKYDENTADLQFTM
jgi:hypothetical protein